MIDRRRFLGGCGRCAISLPFASWASPLAALLDAREAPAQGTGGDAVERWTRSVCDLCGLGELVFLRAGDGKVLAAKGIPQSRTGFGRLCPRARALVESASSADRALRPMRRADPATKGTLVGLEPVSWPEALAAIGEGLRAARERTGPTGVAILASDGETCESYSLLARLAREGLGTDALDTPARLDALPAYDACGAVFGVEANPSSVEDIDAAGLVVMIGGEVADSHPGVYTRVLDARRTGRARVALVDSRKTLAAAVSDVHVRPQPGRELDVVNALAARLLHARAPAEARAWTSWLRGTARAGDGEVEALAAAWSAARGVVTLVGPMALGTAAGPNLARAVAQLHRATEQWGGAGRGLLFLPRGANATGVVALGVRPGRLPAGRRPAGAAATGLLLHEWPAAVREGRLGAILALRANPAAELPDARAWRDALTRCFTVAASTHVPTETTLFADVVLPLATVCGESSGTMMTLDRRCQLLEAAANPPGEAKTLDRMLVDVAAAVLGGASPLAAPPGAPSEWDRWREAARGTKFAADGIPASRLRAELDVAWPCAAEDRPGTVRVDAAIAGTPAYVPTPAPAARAASPQRPFLLVTGPLLEHERSRVRTGRTAELHYEAPTARLEMNPADVGTLALADGEWVTIESETGAATARLWLTERVAPGTLFLPEHYGFLSDLQGGSATQGEPEGLAHLVVPAAPAGVPTPVSVRKARRRDLRQRGADVASPQSG